MKKKVFTPKKGAARKWAERWKKLREQPPPDDLISKLNRNRQDKKVATPRNQTNEMEH